MSENPYEEENNIPQLTYDDGGGENIFKRHLMKTINEYERLLKLDNFTNEQEK